MDHIIQCWILAEYEETKSLDLLSVCQCVRTDPCFLFPQAALESTRDSLAEELVKATTQVCFHILLSVCAVFKEISTTCTNSLTPFTEKLDFNFSQKNDLHWMAKSDSLFCVETT